MNIFDLHCDTIYECLNKGVTLDSDLLHLNIAKYNPDGLWQQVFAFFIPDEVRGEKAKELTGRLINEARHQFSLFEERFCVTPSKGKCRPILAIESGAALGGDIEMLNKYYNAGVRLITLCWNGENELGFGQKTGGHLKPFGFEALSEMERLGITADVSHLSDEGFYDVADRATKPFIASHSASRSVCKHGRNLTDEQFCVIKDRGGLCGLVMADCFLKEGGESDFSDVLRHTEHFLSLGGENTLCIGTDFDGTDLPKGLNSAADLVKLYEYMLKERISESVLNKVFYGNAAGFFGCYA